MSENQNEPQKYHNPSALMSAYNYGKNWAKRTGLATTDRVDRALGYLMNGEAQIKWDEYETATDSCQCPDHQYRSVFCKHMLSKMIATKHDQIMEAEIWQYQKAA